MAKNGRKMRRKRRRKRRLIRQPAVTLMKLASQPFVEPLATGAVDQIIHFRSLTNQFVNDPGTAATVVAPYNFAKIKDMFDMYRVVKIKLTYTAFARTGNYLSAAQQTLPNLYILYDPDNTGLGTAATNLVTGKSVQKSLGDNWTYTVRVPSYSSSNIVQGWQNLQNEQGNLTGVIALKTVQELSPAPPSGTHLGQLKIESWIEFKGRADNNPTTYFGVAADQTLYPPGIVSPQDQYAPPLRDDGIIYGHQYSVQFP